MPRRDAVGATGLLRVRPRRPAAGADCKVGAGIPAAPAGFGIRPRPASLFPLRNAGPRLRRLWRTLRRPRPAAPQNRGRMCQCVRTRPAGPRRATFAPRGGTAADQEGVAPTPACEGTARLHGSTWACVRESGRRHRAASAGCATAPARDNVKSNQIFHILCPLTQALTFRSSNL